MIWDELSVAEVIVQGEMDTTDFSCPGCSNPYLDALYWDEWGEELTCGLCGDVYTP